MLVGPAVGAAVESSVGEVVGVSVGVGVGAMVGMEVGCVAQAPQLTLHASSMYPGLMSHSPIEAQ
jgi:hypothetical protein